MTGLDEEGDSTDDEMPPLEPLEGAAQRGAPRRGAARNKFPKPALYTETQAEWTNASVTVRYRINEI